MNSIIFDTNILIGYLRKNNKCIDLISEISGKQLILISPMTRLEILFGIKKEEISRTKYLLDELCQTVKVSNMTFGISEKIILELRSKNLFIEIPDTIIAASAIENDSVLITSNRKHFERISGLKLNIQNI